MFAKLVIVLICALYFIHHVSCAPDFVSYTTNILGSGPGISKSPPSFSSISIISKITTTFDSAGLTSLQICNKEIIRKGDGSVYAPTPEICDTHGTVSTSSSTAKFSSFEWPTDIRPCILQNGIIAALNISTNLNNYWTAGDFSGCVSQSYSYNEISSKIAIYGVGTGNRFTAAPGIGNLQVAYFYCNKNTPSCPASAYNGGGKCGIRNGGCDEQKTCTNNGSPSSMVCGPCGPGYTSDFLGACRPSRGSTPTYQLTGDFFSFNPGAHGQWYQNAAQMPPFKLSSIFTQFERVSSVPALTSITLTFTRVTLGAYDSSTSSMSRSGWGVNNYPLLQKSTINFPVDEWIVSFSTRRITWPGPPPAPAVAAINITTNLKTYYLNPMNVATNLANQQQFLNGQIPVCFNGTSGEHVDNVNLLGARCTQNCPSTPYGSGRCAASPTTNSICSGGYCQDNSTSYNCACHDGYAPYNATLCLPSFDYCANGFCAKEVSCSLSPGPYPYECGDCPQGYTGSGYTQCQDIDECLSPGDICGLKVCVNSPGSYNCAQCKSGYEIVPPSDVCTDMDECALRYCGGNRNCTNLPGSYTCGACYPGYQFIEESCQDINECAQNLCGPNRNCNNTRGSYICGACYAGYGLQNDSCIDINECALQQCGANRYCTNTPGSFTCGNCFSGYQLQNNSCKDIDECATNQCGSNRDCSNTPGSFSCGACFSGYRLVNGSCIDINECANNSCGSFRNCTNTQGSFTCGNCFSGYTMRNNTCFDIDECASNICGANRNCTNTAGSYRCGSCFSGYQLRNNKCEDINECASRACGNDSICTNLPGSFSCGNCSAGFQPINGNCQDVNECALGLCGDYRYCNNTLGSYVCTNCFFGYELQNGTCSDVDECELSLCGDNRHCNNTQGSYICGTCYDGFALHNATCEDVNECEEVVCGLNRECFNTEGSYECGDCYYGWQLLNESCTDIDECANFTCGYNRICNNSDGSFQCEDCYRGYQLHNDTCEDIDECINASVCGNRLCNNTMGDYVCTDCKTGFTEIAQICQDIDECAVNNGGCSIFATCSNILGSRICDCKPFYFGNGSVCYPLCGDGNCNTETENCVNCPQDCSASHCKICGDGYCEAGIQETCSSCSADCGECNPGSCPGNPPCSDHGVCDSGLCICDATWTGPTCDAKTQSADVEVGEKVVIKLDNYTVFQISLNRIIEFNANMDFVKEERLNSSDFAFVQSNTTNKRQLGNRKWELQLQLPNGAHLLFTIWHFVTAPYTLFSFANQTLTFSPNTIKLNFRISNWPFLASHNFIGIEIGTSGPIAELGLCSNRDINVHKQSVRWLALSYEDVTLYGQYNNLGVIDGRVRNITYTSSPSSHSTNITAIVPHFWDYAEVDPDYSILVHIIDPCAPSSISRLNLFLILVIAIPVFILVILIGIIIIFWSKISSFFQTRGRRSSSTELHSLSRSRASTSSS